MKIYPVNSRVRLIGHGEHDPECDATVEGYDWKSETYIIRIDKNQIPLSQAGDDGLRELTSDEIKGPLP